MVGHSAPQWSNQSIDFKSPLKVVLVVVVVRPLEAEPPPHKSKELPSWP